jgi:hypothetical protein
MKDVPQNELLSAYLDGELTVDEQAEVEQLLAASPGARQLVDELRALSSSLQALPSHQIGEDISQEVLRLAEQAQLDPGAAPEKLKGTAEQPEGPWRAMIRRFTRPRNLVWAGAAAAAALLLVVVQWGQLPAPDRGEIAMETVADDGPATASRPAAPIEAGEQADAEMAAEYPLDAESAPRAMERGRDDLVADKASPREATSASVPAAPPALAANERPMTREPARAPASPGSTGGARGGMGMGRRVAKQSDAIEVQRPARDMPSKDQPKYFAKKSETSAELAERERSTGAKADQPPPGGQRPEPALVVSCWGMQAALQELAFERLLEEQGVRRVATTGPEVDAPAPAPASQPGKAAWYGAQAKPPGVRQVVEVEATRDQLRGLMLSVQRQSGQVLFAYAVPGPEGRELNGERFRWTFDRARRPLAVQEADEMPAGAAQERVGRTEVDKLLDLVEPDRYVRTYRVRFEFHAVDGPGGVAASIAKDAAAAGMIKEPPMAAEAAEEPPAAAAPAAAGAPGPP